MKGSLGKIGFNIVITLILISFIFGIIISRKEKYDIVFFSFSSSFIIIYFFLYWKFSTLPRYVNTPAVLKKRKAQLSEAIDKLGDLNIKQVTGDSSGNYMRGLPPNKKQLINWRPLTVRLSGYLGGRNSVANSVFDTKQGIIHAIKLGARAFVFEIDYLDKRPCEPLLMYRDEQGIMRSLNQGSIKEGMEALHSNAFTENLDPVLIILYLRRIPPRQGQEKKFLSAIANAMHEANIIDFVLKEVGTINYMSTRNEDTLFLNVSIEQARKHFIILINYDTSKITGYNMKTNLDKWIHCRIWQNNSSRKVGITSPLPQAGTIKHAQIGSSDDYLSSLVDASSLDQLRSETTNIFTISLGPVDKSYTTAEIDKLLNMGGIQCIPLDVLGYGESEKHLNTLSSEEVPVDNSTATNPEDPLSFWRFGGWSIKPTSLQRSIQDPLPTITPLPAIPPIKVG
jgi:hypothetical protein